MNNYDEDEDDNEQNKIQEEPEQEILIPFTLDNTTGLTQFEIDVINVSENRVSIDSFPNDYRKKILDFYRFSSVNNNSRNGNAVGSGRNSWK